MSETRKICNMRIASKECIDNMSLPDLKVYRKKAIMIRTNYQHMNKHACVGEWEGVLSDYTEQEVKDIKTLDWLKHYLRKEIKRRTDGTN